MKHTEKSLMKKRGLIKPLSIAMAMSSIIAGPVAFATTSSNTAYTAPGSSTITPTPATADGGFVWCNGDGTLTSDGTAVDPSAQGTFYPAVLGYGADNAPDGLTTNPPDPWDDWMVNPVLKNPPMGLTAETVAPAAPNGNDRYAIQLNYWNSRANSIAVHKTTAPFGYSPGHSCMLFYTSGDKAGQFTITYPASSSLPKQAEIDWHNAHPNNYPTFVPYHNDDGTVNPTKGGPTGYVSTFKGCSWDSNSCTTGSSVPDTGVTPTKSADTNVFPERLSDITSIPSQWTISYNSTYGNPVGANNAWDASYDIWFDKTAQTGHGVAPYGDARGQNDGLEIMVWMNSHGSYVDGAAHADDGTFFGKYRGEDQPGAIQPTGHIRERVVINGVLYDVWVGRLNNPYFAYPGGTVVTPTQFPHDCSTLGADGSGPLCGVEWNVVSFVATKDTNGTDYRNTTMSLDAKVFADYILGIQDGLWMPYGATSDGTSIVANRAANEVLKCPASNKDQSLGATPAPCLSASWFLTSVQAGFETWMGGNGLQSDFFKAHVNTKGAGVQTGLVNDQGQTIIHWGTPFEVVYSDCPMNSGNTVSFNIDGFNSNDGSKLYFPGTPGANPPALGTTAGIYQQMNGPDPVTGQYTYPVPALAPMHGLTTIHFQSACGNYDTQVFIDPSGRVFFADGKTPVQGAAVTLQYSPSGTAGGPFVAVPNHNSGLATPIMQPDDNTQNPMRSTVVGSYAWNTIAGWYKVNASLSGCGSVTTSAQQVTINHPIENLNITLPCAPPQPLPPPPTPTTSGVKVQLTLNGADWQNGYCRNVVLTNTTSKAITWKVNFNLPFPGNITQVWNMNYSKSGNAVTAWGVGWNNVIQPGQTLKDQGFCASK